MKGYLLDTGVALLAVDTPERLSGPVRAALDQGPGFLSVISYWEVIIKAMKNKLDVGDPRLWWQETLDSLALLPLPFRAEHISAIYELPALHQDPFDRALIAQGRIEQLVLLTTDDLICQYTSEQIRVVR